jgi:hypothetical protein
MTVLAVSRVARLSYSRREQYTMALDCVELCGPSLPETTCPKDTTYAR